jgi:hypothetical protein
MPTKYPSPLLGYNNNVRHRGKVFHIQTEDSGVKYGHIITHLFMDGGRILKSVKTSYSEYVGSDRVSEIVREMMKQQHKAMFIALRDGKFDPIVDGATDPSQATQAVAAESPPAPDAAMPTEIATATGARTDDVAAASVGAHTRPRAPQMERHAAVAQLPALDDTTEPQELALDMDALERAAAAASDAVPLFRTASDLPPPPPNLFRDKAAMGKYRVTPPPPATLPTAPPKHVQAGAAAHPQSGEAPETLAPPAGSTPGSDRRYAPTRPAAIFGQTRPQGKSVFGEELISDKSLDEVILSYLAEDLDDKK